MSNEETLIKKLTEQFKYLEGQTLIARQRRIFVTAPRERILEVMAFLKNKLEFNFLCSITGLDVGEDLQFIYHLSRMDGILINVKVNVPKTNPAIQSIISVYNGSIFYERELNDMLGAKVEGLPPGHRYPLPDGWPEGQYPLRKDWKREMLDQKQEVK